MMYYFHALASNVHHLFRSEYLITNEVIPAWRIKFLLSNQSRLMDNCCHLAMWLLYRQEELVSNFAEKSQIGTI